jgi:hypothetical protein
VGADLAAPPRPAASAAAGIDALAAEGLAAEGLAAEALFAEARRRRRRRRLLSAVAVAGLAASILAAAAWFGWWPAPGPGASGRSPRASTAGRSGMSPSVAWVDYDGRLHVANLATARQRVAARTTAYPVTPLVQAGGNLYWVDWGSGFPVVRELDLATGTTRDLGYGMSVFASSDGRHLFIARTGTSVTELPASGSGPDLELTAPRGWYVSAKPAAVAGGIVVQSADEQANPRLATIAVWNLRTGAVTVVGQTVASAYFGPLGVVTPPGAGHSLIAWMPSSCKLLINCPIQVTNTATGSSVTLRSPMPRGFALGGAFSPDGRELAVIVNTSRGPCCAAAELAIASSQTGSLRLVPQARFTIGQDVAWVQWLPGGRQLIAGAGNGSYLVNTATLSARPLFFLRSHDHNIQDSQDMNYSTVVIMSGSLMP